MGRKQTIDRNALLDAADRIIQRDGTSGLTIDAIAAEAGVSKGGVLYAFGTKDAVIEAMFERSYAQYERRAEALRERYAGERWSRALVHVEATQAESPADAARAMSLLAGMVRANEHREEIRRVYGGIFDRLPGDSEQDRLARIAMLAAEGMFMLRGFGLLDVPGAQWDEIFRDIRALVPRGSAGL